MHRKAIAAALFALVAGTSAHTPIPPDVQRSVLLVLATAIPADFAASPDFAAEMAACLAAGNTPAWYQALPTDVLNLLPQIYPLETGATPTPSAPIYATATPNSAAITPSASAPASASASANASASVSASASASVSANASASASIASASSTVNSTSSTVHSPMLTATATAATFTGAASFPTAAVGASVGAVLGFFGMLALY